MCVCVRVRARAHVCVCVRARVTSFVQVPVPLETCPLFVRAGTIVPLLGPAVLTLSPAAHPNITSMDKDDVTAFTVTQQTSKQTSKLKRKKKKKKKSD